MCPPAKVNGVWPFNDAWLRTSVVVGQTPGATQRCLNPGFSERIRNSRRTRSGRSSVPVSSTSVLTNAATIFGTAGTRPPHGHEKRFRRSRPRPRWPRSHGGRGSARRRMDAYRWGQRTPADRAPANRLFRTTHPPPTVPTTPAGARTRSSASPGTKLTRPAAASDSRPLARRRWWGGFSRSHHPLPRPWTDGGHAATPTARWSSTATASQSAAGARRGIPVRRLYWPPHPTLRRV